MTAKSVYCQDFCGDITLLNIYCYTMARTYPEKNLMATIFSNFFYFKGKFDENYDFVIHVCLNFLIKFCLLGCTKWLSLKLRFIKFLQINFILR